MNKTEDVFDAEAFDWELQLLAENLDVENRLRPKTGKHLWMWCMVQKGLLEVAYAEQMPPEDYQMRIEILDTLADVIVVKAKIRQWCSGFSVLRYGLSNSA